MLSQMDKHVLNSQFHEMMDNIHKLQNYYNNHSYYNDWDIKRKYNKEKIERKSEFSFHTKAVTLEPHRNRGSERGEGLLVFSENLRI